MSLPTMWQKAKQEERASSEKKPVWVKALYCPA